MTETGMQSEQLYNNLADRIRFERLISDLSARFVNLPQDQVDPAIEAALMEILEFFHVDQVALLRHEINSEYYQHTHVAIAPGISPVPIGVYVPTARFPYSFKKIVVEHTALSFGKLDDLPEEAAIDRQNFADWEVRSGMNIPISLKKSFMHIISIASARSTSLWPEIYIPRLRLIGEIFVNALELKQTRQELEDRLKFEELLSLISAKFLNLPSTQVDNEIVNVLHRIVQFLELDRCIVTQFSDGSSLTILTHFAEAPRVRTTRREFDNEEIPWVVENLRRGKAVVFSSPEDLPVEAARDREFYKTLGIISCATLPLMVSGNVLGFLGCSILHTPRTWRKEVLQGLQLLADVFANAIARKYSDGALQAAEHQYRTVLESTLAWLYWENPDGTIRYMSPSCERITGVTEREFMEKPGRIREIVVAEDRQLWDSHFHDSRRAPGILEIQFRIRHRDGSLRWIEHTCMPMIDPQGASLGFRISNRDITPRKEMEAQLLERYKEIRNLKQQLEKENIYLRKEIQLQHVHEEIVGRSEVMINVLSQAEQVATTDSTVLIQGETGTGKELLARAIHRLSQRKDRPLVTVNCACLPLSLMESELFGREKGAYTGALTRMAGRFEAADGSTIFLDEIGELPLEIQSKLLRVLEEGRFERLGSTKTIQVNVRIIAATNKDLDHEVKEGAFRKDLFYRLNVFPVTVPPLRERSEDIPRLVWALVRQLEQKIGKRIDSVSRKTMTDLQRYSWPGNVRELRNTIEHAMIVSKNSKLIVYLPGRAAAAEAHVDSALEDLERRHIIKVLEKTGWRISGSNGAAEILGIKRTTLQSRIKKLEIKRP
jgi:formate hydrogenlyase transcriptional activator